MKMKITNNIDILFGLAGVSLTVAMLFINVPLVFKLIHAPILFTIMSIFILLTLIFLLWLSWDMAKDGIEFSGSELDEPIDLDKLYGEDTEKYKHTEEDK